MSEPCGKRTAALRVGSPSGTRYLLLGGMVLIMGAMPAVAGDASAGREKAKACAVCHGPVGLSQAPNAPNLAGQPVAYLTAQLKAFRDGQRRHEVMNVVAKPLSDSDIDNLAAWFASIEITVKAPD